VRERQIEKMKISVNKSKLIKIFTYRVVSPFSLFRTRSNSLVIRCIAL